MKYYTLFIVVVFMWAMIPKLSNASCVLPKTNEPALIATKGNKLVKYTIGSFISVLYGTNSKKINGLLLATKNDSIRIQPNNKKEALTTIATKDIQWVMKLHKRGRNGWITTTAVLVVLTILGLILSATKNFLALFLLAAPVVSLFTFFPFLIGSFLSDLLSKKSVKKGWVFSSKGFSAIN